MPIDPEPEPDYYEILQVPAKADRKAIGAAYRRLARRYHPDVSTDAAATQRMRELNTAVEILSDPRRRAEYDRRRARLRAQGRMAAGKSASVFPAIYLAGGRAVGGLRARRAGRVPIALATIVGAVLLAIGVLIGISIQVASDSSEGPRAAGGVVPTERAGSTTPVVAAATSPPTPSPTPPVQGSATFSNGTWLVGEEIAPGIWRAVRSRTCTWRRMSSIEGATDVVAAEGNYLTVEIPPSDAAFWSDGCGWWSQILTPPSESPSDPFGPGTWLVVEEIAPGLWQNSDSSEGCTWARLSGLSGGPAAVNANGSTTSTLTVQISESDRAFDSSGCGTWTRIGG